jgi:hypothetical protein
LIISVIIGERLLNESIEKIQNLLKRNDLQHIILKKAFLNYNGEVKIEEI